jgi:hypothetical protein
MNSMELGQIQSSQVPQRYGYTKDTIGTKNPMKEPSATAWRGFMAGF